MVEKATSKINTISTSLDRVAIGFENGKIMVWENDLFMRRLESKENIQLAGDSSIAARLRSLRK